MLEEKNKTSRVSSYFDNLQPDQRKTIEYNQQEEKEKYIALYQLVNAFIASPAENILEMYYKIIDLREACDEPEFRDTFLSSDVITILVNLILENFQINYSLTLFSTIIENYHVKFEESIPTSIVHVLMNIISSDQEDLSSIALNSISSLIMISTQYQTLHDEFTPFLISYIQSVPPNLSNALDCLQDMTALFFEEQDFIPIKDLIFEFFQNDMPQAIIIKILGLIRALLSSAAILSKPFINEDLAKCLVELSHSDLALRGEAYLTMSQLCQFSYQDLVILFNCDFLNIEISNDLAVDNKSMTMVKQFILNEPNSINLFVSSPAYNVAKQIMQEGNFHSRIYSELAILSMLTKIDKGQGELFLDDDTLSMIPIIVLSKDNSYISELVEYLIQGIQRELVLNDRILINFLTQEEILIQFDDFINDQKNLAMEVSRLFDLLSKIPQE